MSEAIAAYRHVSTSDQFAQIEKMRSKARHDEAQAINHALMLERQRWQGILADKDDYIARLLAQLEER